MLNKQGPGKIDWTDWTWNPISGCKHGCPYCYMHRMEKRFPGIMEPAYKPGYIEKFKSVRKVKAGDKIFVGSSGDMWGNWVPDEWIGNVLDLTDSHKDKIFQFLTKNPVMYGDFRIDGMSNCWFGTSEDGTWKTLGNHKLLVDKIPKELIKFVSFEPLIENPKISSKFYELNWIIIGADSNRGAKKAPKEWADFLIREAREENIPVWVKDNYGYPEVIKEFPDSIKEEIEHHEKTHRYVATIRDAQKNQRNVI